VQFQTLSANVQKELIQAVASSRDRQAFTQLFDYFAPRLIAYLQQLGADPAGAEEITQDAMSVLWLKAEQYDAAKSSVATWLYRVARNRRIDRLRQNRVDFLDPLDSAFDLPSPELPADQALDGWQREQRVRAALDTLAEEQRLLINLAFFEDLSHAQIATKSGLPLGTVKSRLRLAFTRLRRILEAEGLE